MNQQTFTSTNKILKAKKIQNGFLLMGIMNWFLTVIVFCKMKEIIRRIWEPTIS